MNPAPKPAPGSSRLTVRAVAEAVCIALDVSMHDLRSARRLLSHGRARIMVYGLADELTDASMPIIGRVLGRDHTTVHGGIQRHAELCATDPDYARDAAAIRATLLALHRRQLHAYLDRLDPVEIARRIIADPRRGVHTASTLEIIALAEHVAARADADDISESPIAEDEDHADAR